jgi:hypothetical protein
MDSEIERERQSTWLGIWIRVLAGSYGGENDFFDTKRHNTFIPLSVYLFVNRSNINKRR